VAGYFTGYYCTVCTVFHCAIHASVRSAVGTPRTIVLGGNSLHASVIFSEKIMFINKI